MVDRLKPLYAKYRTKGFEILGIGANSNDTQAKQIAWCKQNGIEWVELWDADRDVMNKYNVRAFPTMVFIDPDGKIIYASAYSKLAQVEKIIAENCTEEYVEKPTEPGSDGEVRRRLNEDAPELDFSDSPLADVIKHLAESTAIPFHVDDSAKELLSSESANITLSGGKLKDVLELLSANHGVKWEVKDKGIRLFVEKPREMKYAEGTDEYKKWMEIAKMLLPASHRALDEKTVTESMDALDDRNRERMDQMLRGLAGRASGEDRKLLREFRDMLKEAE